jgi:hypothetical protein
MYTLSTGCKQPRLRFKEAFLLYVQTNFVFKLYSMILFSDLTKVSVIHNISDERKDTFYSLKDDTLHSSERCEILSGISRCDILCSVEKSDILYSVER